MNAPSSLIEIARARRQAQLAAGHGGTATAMPKVLFVDDEDRILRAVQSLFRLRYDVHVTTDGAQALELLRQQHFHLIVSDQRMPQMEGIEVLRAARDISPCTVRILLTGFADLAAIVGSVNEGEVYRYLNKPWDNQELIATVDEAVQVGVALMHEHASAATAEPPDTSATTDPALPNRASLAAAQHTVLFLEHGSETLDAFNQLHIGEVRALAAQNQSQAIDLMEKEPVSVLIAAVDGPDSSNIDFLYALKKEHPHIVTIALSNSADASQVVDLINSARVFRLLFRPIKQASLQLYLKTALRKANNFYLAPAQIQTQRVDSIRKRRTETEHSHTLVSELGARLMSIKGLFSRTS